MGYLRKTALEKQARFRFGKLLKYGLLGGLGLGGLGTMYAIGAERQRQQLKDWQKDPSLGINRKYVDSSWNF